ncbi:MAG: DUF1013 domain-containing protein [Dongiaceae bacterium]
MAQKLLMPKATAVWLVNHTTLSFEQIADFCELHELEVQAIADGEASVGIHGADPIVGGQLTREEIERCEKEPRGRLKIAKSTLPQPKARSSGPRYTPVTKRQDKPDGIAWLIKNHPELGDSQIARLIGTTKATIAAIRDRSHWNSANIKARNPVALGLCAQPDLESALRRAQRKAERLAKAAGASSPAANAEAPVEPASAAEPAAPEETPKPHDLDEAI